MLALLSAGGSVLHAQDVLPLTLESAIARAQAHNLTALASRAGVAALEGARMATLAGLAPSLSIVETVGRTTDAVGVFGTKLRQERFTEADFALDALNRPDAVTNASTALQLRQPIFNAVAWAQRRAATARVAAGVARDARHRDRLALETCRAYHGLALAQSHLTVVRSGLEAAQSHVRQTQALFEAGAAPLSDVLTAPRSREPFAGAGDYCRICGCYRRGRFASGDGDEYIAPYRPD